MSLTQISLVWEHLKHKTDGMPNNTREIIKSYFLCLTFSAKSGSPKSKVPLFLRDLGLGRVGPKEQHIVSRVLTEPSSTNTTKTYF